MMGVAIVMNFGMCINSTENNVHLYFTLIEIEFLI